MTELVKIDPAEYGLTEDKAKQVSSMFKPMLEKMEELETEFNEVVELDMSEETCAKAKEVRLKYVKVRTGTAKIHKELKAFYLQGGRFVDGWKNAQLMASQGKEEKLQEIEKYYENLEKERIANLQAERAAMLGQYEVETIPGNLGEMEDLVWDNFLAGTKANYEARIAAEKKAEEERIAREKAEQEERERIRKENERLKAEAEAARIQAEKEAAERAEAARIEAEKRAKEEAERKAKEEAAKKEHEAQLKKEREEKERIAAELKAKQEAERKAKEAEAARVEAELKKGDAEKFADLIADLEGLKGKYEFQSKANQKMYNEVQTLIDKVIGHIQKYDKVPA